MREDTGAEMETEMAGSEQPYPPQLLELMRSCGVRTPPHEFIREVSNAFHEIEAPGYDHLHQEIASQVTPRLQEFGTLVKKCLAGKTMRVLEVGCGTGFASWMLCATCRLEIASLVCSDISPHMLEICRRKFEGRPGVQFVEADLEHLSRSFSPFEMVLTCSVVHHVADLTSFFVHLRKLLAPGGFYMMLHEPSRRYYANSNCLRFFEQYQTSRRRRARLRYLDPARYVRKAIRLVERATTPCMESKVSELLLKRNVIQWPLTQREVRQLVDIHVPPIHTGTFFMGSEGLDLHALRQRYLAGFVPVCFRSYGFLGTEFEEVAGRCWQAKALELARRYPEDGAQFSALWRAPGAAVDEPGVRGLETQTPSCPWEALAAGKTLSRAACG